jgi:hypothetical protein
MKRLGMLSTPWRSGTVSESHPHHPLFAFRLDSTYASAHFAKPGSSQLDGAGPGGPARPRGGPPDSRQCRGHGISGWSKEHHVRNSPEDVDIRPRHEVQRTRWTNSGPLAPNLSTPSTRSRSTITATPLRVGSAACSLSGALSNTFERS